MSHQERPGGTPEGILSCSSLREVKISKDARLISFAQLAAPASQALSPSLCRVLFIPSFYPANITCPPRALPQQMYQVQSQSPTNAALLCSVRLTNTCVLLAKNPSSRVLSCACFSRTSFHLCLLQQKHFFTCVSQQNTIQHN